eukprot:gene16114-4428_t
MEKEWKKEDFNVRLWWESRSADIPLLASRALAWLSMPVTSVECERAFSVAKLILDDYGREMRPELFIVRMSLMINGP